MQHIGTWYENDAVTANAQALWDHTKELRTQGASSTEIHAAENVAYDYTMKRFGKRCDGCEHYHAVLWESRMGGPHGGLCWQCCEKKYGCAPIMVPSNEIESCVCCREMKLRQ